jgi:hypothetical protein
MRSKGTGYSRTLTLVLVYWQPFDIAEGTLAPCSLVRTEACCAGHGTWTLLDLEAEIASRTLCAVAEASALSILKADECLGAGIVYGGEGAICQNSINRRARR